MNWDYTPYAAFFHITTIGSLGIAVVPARYGGIQDGLKG